MVTEYPLLLTEQGFHMDGPEQADTHHLRNAASIITIALIDLGFEERIRVSRTRSRSSNSLIVRSGVFRDQPEKITAVRIEFRADSEASERFGLVSPPHAGRDNAQRTSFGPNRVTEVISPIGAVGEHLAWIIGQGVGSGASLTVAGVIAISWTRAVVASAPTWALKPCIALMLDPAAIYIVFAGRSDDRRIDQHANLDRDALALSCAATASNSATSRPCATSALRYRTKAVRSGVALLPEKQPQNRRKDARSSSASASFTSDKSYQIDSVIGT
jgi:hypothetical protein